MIRQRSIRNLGRHLRGFSPGDRVIAALRVDEAVTPRLIEAGFTGPIDVGQSVLPSFHLGKTAHFNAEGKDEVHRDSPLETVYYPVEWTHEQWNGPYTETVTTIIDRPYKRRPRSFIAPPSVELTVRESRDGMRYVCAPERIVGRDDSELLHDVNLILDIANECELLGENLVSPVGARLRRLNWEVLPQGHYPWAALRPRIRPAIERLPAAAKPVIEHRLEHISRFRHDFVAIGKAGFAGYVVFAFPAAGIYVLECIHEGNATYVLGDGWEQISQMTKAEVLREGRHLHRLIHTQNWRHAVGSMMVQHGCRY